MAKWDLSKIGRAPEHMPTAAQQVSRMTAEQALAEFATEVDAIGLCDAVVAILAARPDLTPQSLHDLSNRIGRYADEVERTQ